jgi:basic membrane lipoprotein Med (substrate-binding protein (PBP1-ABC) superfamily)
MLEDYARARKLGLRQKGRDVSAGRYPFVAAFDDFYSSSDLGAEIPLGVMEIPVSLVAGTKTRGRQNTFSSGFMPLLGADTEFAMKWSNVFDAQRNEGLRDPIVVYEYLQHFYVQEGNKRLSVVKYVGNPVIVASVTRILPRHGDERAIRIYGEFVRFFRVAPIYDLVFSREGSFERLAGMLGRNLEERWPDEAVVELRSGLARFERAYEQRSSEELPLTSADAFLVYLRIYGFPSVLEDSQATIGQKVAKIRGELAAASAEDPIVFLRDPHAFERPSIVPTIVSSLRSAVEPRPFRVAFIYDSDPDSSSWVWSHEMGRHELEQRMKGRVETVAFSGCADERAFDKAVDTAIADEADLVVTTSNVLSERTLRAAVAHPDVIFINCSLHHAASSMRAFHGRMYEAMFVLGAIAAAVADNHAVGYLVASPAPSSTAETNAFALGAQLVDAHAKVFLARGDGWEGNLSDAGVRVVMGHDAAEPGRDDFGLYELRPDGTRLHLACPVWNWGRYYELIVRSIQNGRWASEDVRDGRVLTYWWGMSAGVIDIDYFEGLPAGSRKLAACLEDAVRRGAIDPFEGELRSQGGIVHRQGDRDLSPAEIIDMRWLNGNVVGSFGAGPTGEAGS